MSGGKRLWTILLLIVVVAAGVWGVNAYRNNTAEAEIEEETLQTATVRRGEIVISASGAGTVIPAAQLDVSFQSGGLLTELLVEVGDAVQAGDVLARVDDTQARQALIAAELQLFQAQEKLADQLDTAPEQQDLELAQANLALAQLKLDDLLEWTPDEQEIEQAQSNLDAAQADYEASQAKSPYDQTTSARISLDQAQQSLADAQEAYDTAYDPARDWELNDPRKATKLENERDSAERNLEKAQQNLEIAQANYNLAWAGVSESAELTAWNKVLSAQATLETAQTGPTEEEIQSAEIQVLQSQIALTNAQSALDASSEELELSVEQAELNLKSVQQDVENTALVAPMDGTVMSVAAAAGEMASSGVFITLADIEQPSIEIYLDETDLNSVGVGFEVEVIFDALPDDLFTGRVTQVDPALVTVQQVPMVRAVVQLDESSYSKPQIVPIGANASVDVIGGRAENALLVPVEALNEISAGQYAVFVVVDGEPLFTPVEVGLMDYSFAQILSGVQAGDVVTTGIVETGG